jgi:vacuolar-type H+-ATPase subunit E/Vma4
MPIEDIAVDIISEAKKKSKEISEEAVKQSNSITADARKKADAIIEQAKKEAQEKAESMLNEHIAEFEVERHNAMLLAQNLVVEKELAATKRLFIKKIEAQYSKILKHAVKAMEASSGGFTIAAEKKYIKLVRSMGYDAQQISNGIHIKSPDGNATMDLSPENLFNENIELLKSRISLSLFYKIDEKIKRKAAKISKQKPKKSKRGKH